MTTVFIIAIAYTVGMFVGIWIAHRPKEETPTLVVDSITLDKG